jgi:hypothetical protein
MPLWQQIQQVGTKRWLDSTYQRRGINVIPAVGWGGEASFDFCFDGVPKGCIVSVSTLGASENRGSFMNGFIAMCNALSPTTIICYGKPFAEMRNYHHDIRAFPLDSVRRRIVKKTQEKNTDQIDLFDVIESLEKSV